MVNGIDKKALFRLVAVPYLKPISDLGVGFYNLDENTAKIEFQLYNSKGPLLISENNIDAYAYFESANGSASDVIDLEVLDGLNGVVGITLDKEFLQASTDTKVKGQVYVGANNVDNNPEYNEVAVFTEFTFEVADTLINKISSFTKIEYIRMFDQLKARILQRVSDIEQAIANGADYVAEMKNVKEQSIAQINQTVSEGKAYIDNVITQTQTNINDTVTSAIDDVNTTKDKAISTMNSKVDESISNVENVSNNTVVHVEEKLNEFNQAIINNEFVQPELLQQTIDNLDWQRYKTTNANGQVRNITGTNLSDNNVLDNLKPGLFYSSSTEGQPSGASSKHGLVNVIEREDKGYKKIIFMPYNSTQSFQKYKLTEWTNWQQIGVPSDTGWIPFQLINGALSNTAYKENGDNGFDCAYKTVTTGNSIKRVVRINGSNLTHNRVIAQLPANFVKNTQAYPVRVPAGDYTGYVVFRPSGEVTFVLSGDRSAWNDTGYAYGECSWID